VRPADLQSAIPDPLRQVYEGMAYFMDEHIQIIVDAIKAKGVWNQTLVVFSSELVPQTPKEREEKESSLWLARVPVFPAAQIAWAS